MQAIMALFLRKLSLKGSGSLTQTQIDSILKFWQCPWCFTAPFPKPGSHTSSLKEIALIEKTLSSSLYQNVAESITESIKAISNTIDFSPIETQLEKLTSNLEEFKMQRATSSHPSPDRSPPVHTKVVMDSPERPFDLHKENFLTGDELEQMKDLLGSLKDGGDFVNEKGHSVKIYGQAYSYTGSRSKEQNPDPIPEELVAIIDRLCTELSLDTRPNSVLINYFPASSGQSTSDSSYLAMHSDDEPTIMANSKIVTLSIGESRKIRFEPKHNNEDQVELLLKHNSLYSMRVGFDMGSLLLERKLMNDFLSLSVA
jgi:hypothetical protein